MSNELNKAGEAYDDLTKKLCQLSSMLEMTYGDARDEFQKMNDGFQSHYMWACADIAKDCGDLLAAIPYPVSRKVSHG